MVPACACPRPMNGAASTEPPAPVIFRNDRRFNAYLPTMIFSPCSIATAAEAKRRRRSAHRCNFAVVSLRRTFRRQHLRWRAFLKINAGTRSIGPGGGQRQPPAALPSAISDRRIRTHLSSNSSMDIAALREPASWHRTDASTTQTGVRCWGRPEINCSLWGSRHARDPHGARSGPRFHCELLPPLRSWLRERRGREPASKVRRLNAITLSVIARLW